VTFTFQGRPITAIAGQTIAAALYAAGQRIFTRSFKYHRPRGLFCLAGDCPGCLMRVDDRPNVRTCIEPAQDGQVVSPQNVWPALGFDLLRVFDRLDRFLPVGFYYKRFHKPRWLWPVFEKIIRHIAGLGFIDPHTEPHVETEVEYLHTDVCVVGGGPAGLAAAQGAAEAGAGVLLVERLPRLGGHLLYAGRSAERLEPLLAQVRSHVSVRILCDATAFGLYEGNLLGVVQGQRLVKVRARQIIGCTGARQQPFVFHNNDLPGVLLGDGVLRLARLYGVRAGRRAVVFTENEQGHKLADELDDMGIEVAAVVDLRPAPSAHTERPGNRLVLMSSIILRARGNTHLKAVRVAQLDEHGTVDLRTEQEIDCDLLCLASNRVPAKELHSQGQRTVGSGQWAAKTDGSGIRGQESGVSEPGISSPPTANCPLPTFLPTAHDSRDGKRFVCLCEDVTQKDLEQAVAEGFDHIETLKRYSTVNMGPCQGKVCASAAAAVCARATGRDLGAVGTTTSRPPAVSVELGVLAAGQHHPVRRTPLHHWHREAGARWLDAGQWKRPESYGDPAAEVRAVRSGIGLIDVSTLGKFEVIGPDAATLLERVYLNRWADLKVDRSRYGAMCTEEGILFDDGVGARLGAEQFYLTATTGNADAVVSWLELWKESWRLDAVILNQTSALAAMNLAGPRARAVLSRVARFDVSAKTFPYQAVREGEVAGVPCRLLRLGFVGELGYEIHCPSSYAWHVWESLLDAGREFGLRPFGVEAQRILRLEKGHLILGQDTDALSNPLEAGLEWLVHFDKPSFHGREPLLRLRAMGARARLVGFQLEADGRPPEEGCQVVERGHPVGRVTSIRHSPTLRRNIGLAWLPSTSAGVGKRFLIRSGGTDVPALVAALPFYDPQGLRLKA
jgi:sarcosine oxidase subunit alpha